MNLLDYKVKRVIGTKEFDATTGWNLSKDDKLNGNKFTIFVVEYDDYGALKTTELWFEKGKEEAIKEGYVFQG